MFEDVLVIGLVMAFMELIKKYLPGFPKEAFFVPIIVLAAAFNAGSAYFFGAGEILLVDAIAEGIKLGAMAGGVFSLGKAALGRS